MIAATNVLLIVIIVMKAFVVPFEFQSSSSNIAKINHTSTVLKLSLMISIVLSSFSSNGLTITRIA